MWPPEMEEKCTYGFDEDSSMNLHEHYHHHHHHYPHSSIHHTECFQTLSCPSDLPVDSSFYQQIPPTYQELGQIDLSPPLWCAEVDCVHEQCVRKEIPHEQSKIFEEISKECEHLLKESDCDKCRVEHEDGGSEAIPINDLVDIVMQTVDSIKNNDSANGEVQLLSRKRQQNKVAAARYRDKQKAKWKDLLNNQTVEEKRNLRLKGHVAELEKEVAELRAQLLARVANK